MAFELREGQGFLFRNDRKKTGKHPDYKGTVCIEGTTYELVAWLKEGKKGKFLSLKASMPREGGYERSSSGRIGAGDDDIPF